MSNPDAYQRVTAPIVKALRLNAAGYYSAADVVQVVDEVMVAEGFDTEHGEEGEEA